MNRHQVRVNQSSKKENTTFSSKSRNSINNKFRMQAIAMNPLPLPKLDNILLCQESLEVRKEVVESDEYNFSGSSSER